MKPNKFSKLIYQLRKTDLNKIENKNLIRDKIIKSDIHLYTVLQLIRTFKRTTKIEINNADGWIDVAKEDQIQLLYKEISRLKMIKLVEFPKIDKRWKIGLGIVSVITIILIVASLQLSEKSTALEKSVAQKEVTTQTLSSELENVKTQQDDLKKKQKRIAIRNFCFKKLKQRAFAKNNFTG